LRLGIEMAGVYLRMRLTRAPAGRNMLWINRAVNYYGAAR
jgi:hypothetical protein